MKFHIHIPTVCIVMYVYHIGRNDLTGPTQLSQYTLRVLMAVYQHQGRNISWLIGRHGHYGRMKRVISCDRPVVLHTCRDSGIRCVFYVYKSGATVPESVSVEENADMRPEDKYL